MLILYSAPGLTVAASGIRDTGPAELDRIASALSPEYAFSLNKKNKKAADESLSGALLLLDVLSFLRLSPSKVVRGEMGKPFFESGGPCFSISHDGNAVICAVSAENTGIDLMHLPVRFDSSRRCAVAKRFFTKEEYLQVSAAESEGDGGALFASLWTLREAVSKRAGGALGEMLGRPLPAVDRDHRFEFSLAGEKYTAVCVI